MHHVLSILLGVAALVVAAPNPNQVCQTVYVTNSVTVWETATVTSTYTSTSTSTADCPIVSAPLSPIVTGTIVPVQSITSDLGAALPSKRAEVRNRGGEKRNSWGACTVTCTENETCTETTTSTVVETTSTVVTYKPDCPIVSLPLSPIVTGTIVPVQSITSDVGSVLSARAWYQLF